MKLSTKYGPDVVEAVLSAARVEGYSTLICSVFLIALSLVFVVAVVPKMWSMEFGQMILNPKIYVAKSVFGL